MKEMLIPKSMEMLAEALKRKDEHTLIIAGGTDLSIEINEGKVDFSKIIDISSVAQMREIKKENNSLIIGACATFTEIEENILIKELFAALADASSEVGSKQIRNKGTIGGSLMNASAAGDIFPVMLALSANAMVYKSDMSMRIVPIDELVQGVSSTDLAKDEVLAFLILPIMPNTITAFAKLGARKKVTISKVNMAICATVECSVFKNVKVALGAVGQKAFISPEASSFIEGKKICDVDGAVFGEILEGIVDRAIPTRKSRFYKREAIKGVGLDLLKKCEG